MASTLVGGRSRDRVTDKGHGTDALGPSDTSDSGCATAAATAWVVSDAGAPGADTAQRNENAISATMTTAAAKT